MKHIAILLTVFNRKRETLLCLKNLKKQQIPPNFIIDIYLTNDGCTDGTPEVIASLYPQVHVINGNGSLFWNRGMYVAWQEAAKKNYDFYLWLNDDTFVYPYMIDRLLKTASDYHNQAIIVGATQSLDHKKTTYGGRLNNGSIPLPHGYSVQVDYFNGNIVLIPSYVYLQLGNLDYYFTHSKGDFDYGLRAQKAGIKIYQVGEYLGECDVHPTLDKWCNPNIPFNQRWKMLHRPNGMPPKETFHLENKHYGWMQAAFHYCTIYLRCLFPQLWTSFKP
jgi:GT2 family glycosyltransferase